ncbi:MAG: preprotein translocase subunit SecA [Nevskiaceae bacterium]|nr:MAG: preprotein translocase subunit SecA [Nevskiaceae bacterium]TBR73394.1 MAG: preprotein translocase subunit SecA [Nevskiaceae bacterium]
MPQNLLTRLLGRRNRRHVRHLRGFVAKVNALEAHYQGMTDTELASQTARFRERLDNGEALSKLREEAFAVMREASKRVLGMRHFDVQLIGGAILDEGRIAEMRTGEGKTLVATLPCYLNALPGKGVHVVTVNDYLAKRDAEWMGRVHRFLGLEVGTVLSGQPGEEKRAAYAADITYATNNELGFDYLRDNMAFALSDKVQRGLNYAVVDEVDSILIDEARTPLIISGPTDDDTDLYRKLDALVPKLTVQKEEDGPGDFSVDEKQKQIYLTEDGQEKVEGLLREIGLLAADDSLYEPSNIQYLHHLNALLRAHHIYHRNVDYLVRNGEVVIVDEFTGRTMPGRRWSEGLHQAIEAKEGVRIQQENQTLASITFQNYFRLYDKLSGMTGTAETEAEEFEEIYGLQVSVVPTNRPMIRDDRPDLIYLTEKDKFEAVAEDVAQAHTRRQPVLVGTASIETSEILDALLKKKNIPHEVLNAKQHEREAEIVAQAGRPGAVTIATNMAGRGTDIVLGGSLEADLATLPGEDRAARDKATAEWQVRHDEAISLGGLYVLGSERHESRRIDNQLRGRSGRQGDPGASRFYLSLDDNLMRVFTPPSMRKMLMKLGMQEGEALEHRLVTRSIETAQEKVEGHNFDIRKNLLDYDNVSNEQRKAVYELRDELMGAERITPMLDEIRSDVVDGVVNEHVPPQSPEESWHVEGLEAALQKELGLELPIRQWLKDDSAMTEVALHDRIREALVDAYAAKKEMAGAEVMERFEKAVALQTLDRLWREHLAAMDYLRLGIHLRGYAQQNPKNAYKREGFGMFNDMLAHFKQEVVSTLSRVRVQTEEEITAAEAERRRREQARALQFQHEEAVSATAGAAGAAPAAGAAGDAPAQRAAQHPAAQPETFVRDAPKVGRNDPCPCGSGKKYKNCHGRLA